ncbi:large ribosomal subunit protein mL48 isoform X2 [Dendrobates tinctorius]|uniref:large ribosomal subunit protein mL48 isoform X2 n=1 Tax=Dendrobates tinctorius TaxID=92724 RepID=UPI003CCA073C
MLMYSISGAAGLTPSCCCHFPFFFVSSSKSHNLFIFPSPSPCDFLFYAGRITGHSWLQSCNPGVQVEDRRSYRSQPTHGIGRYRFLLPPEVDQKKKGKLLKKEIKQGTEYEYGVLNFQVSGHNMLYVEHFAQYMHNFFNQMSIKVEESYAKPTKTMEMLLLPDVGNKMFVDSVLTIHERIVQVSGVSATMAPIIIEVFTMNQPEGVKLLVKEHTDTDYLERFKARPDLDNLRASIN